MLVYICIYSSMCFLWVRQCVLLLSWAMRHPSFLRERMGRSDNQTLPAAVGFRPHLPETAGDEPPPSSPSGVEETELSGQLLLALAYSWVNLLY